MYTISGGVEGKMLNLDQTYNYGGQIIWAIWGAVTYVVNRPFLGAALLALVIFVVYCFLACPGFLHDCFPRLWSATQMVGNWGFALVLIAVWGFFTYMMITGQYTIPENFLIMSLLCLIVLLLMAMVASLNTFASILP